MRSYSKRALAQFSPVFTAIVTASDEKFVISQDLFDVEKIFSENSPLLRAITDPSRTEEDKTVLVDKLLANSIDKSSLEIIKKLIAMRWSKETDLLEALETLAIEALLLQADKEEKLHKIESDLFAVVNILKKDRQLRNTLTDVRTYDVKDRVSLMEKIFASQVDEFSLKLLKRAIIHTKRTGLSVYISHLAEVVAAHTNNLLATVTVATPLNAQQTTRLEEILHKAYGKQVIINELIDKELIGGIRIRIGQTLIDGSLLSSMEQARQSLAS